MIKTAMRAGAFNFVVIIAAMILALSQSARAQTDSRLMLDPWPTDQTWGMTYDDMLYQGQSHSKGETIPGGDDAKAQLFWWDSIGRFRLGTSDPYAPRLAYRYVTMNFDSDSRFLPRHLDEMSAAAGLHLGQIDDGDVSAIIGAGYSGDNPFADAGGVFAIAHLLWDKPINRQDSFVLSVDYNGVAALLPDIPLPGAEYIHRDKTLSYTLGFPRSQVQWEMLPALTLDAGYSAPYTADVVLDYRLSPNWSVFGGYHNFFNAYRLDDRPLTDRLMVQMSRVEMGIHYTNPDFVLEGAYFDISFAVGYAFDQNYSRGFDVRDADHIATLSDAPYAALMLRGRF